MRLDLEQWRELASPIYEVYPDEPDEMAGVNIEIEETEGLFLAKIAAPAQMLVHDPTTHNNACHDYLLFERFYEGGGQAEVGDTGFEVAPSRLHLIDMSQRYVSRKRRSFSRGICIPHALLGYQRGEEPVFSSVEMDSPKGRLLAAAHAELLNTPADKTAGDTALIAQTFVGLVRQLMLGSKPGHAPTGDRELPFALLLQDHITNNLQDPGLNAETLSTTFGVSRATLYRHFEKDGGIARTIRNRRLDRCFFELSRVQPGRGRVAAVARRWHFTDPKHFNRLFHERFGMAPSECLSAIAPSGSGAPSNQIRIVEHWLERFQDS